MKNPNERANYLHFTYFKLIKSRKQGKEVFSSLADRHIVEVFEISEEPIFEDKNEKNC